MPLTNDNIVHGNQIILLYKNFKYNLQYLPCLLLKVWTQRAGAEHHVVVVTQLLLYAHLNPYLPPSFSLSLSLSLSLTLSLSLSICSLPVCTLKYKHCELYSQQELKRIMNGNTESNTLKVNYLLPEYITLLCLDF